jgi:uncharacterized protein YjlB
MAAQLLTDYIAVYVDDIIMHHSWFSTWSVAVGVHHYRIRSVTGL